MHYPNILANHKDILDSSPIILTGLEWLPSLYWHHELLSKPEHQS